jgi:hypothetical protein
LKGLPRAAAIILRPGFCYARNAVRKAGASTLREIANALNARGVRTARGELGMQ